MDDPPQPTDLPPLLRVPLEIRLQIYRHLLIHPTTPPSDPENPLRLDAHPDYHEYDFDPSSSSSSSSGFTDPDHTLTDSNRTLTFRTTNPSTFKLSQHHAQGKRRTPYKIRSGRFRAECMDVTYACTNLPRSSTPTTSTTMTGTFTTDTPTTSAISTSILRTTRQLHTEATPLLYTHYTFSFDTHIEGVVPFLSDLTPYSRSFIRRFSLVKKAIAYDKDFDRCEWRVMCGYISRNLRLKEMELGVVAGRPTHGLELIRAIPEGEFAGLIEGGKRDEMAWVRDLMLIKGLQKLEVRACVEHCPPPQSNALMFFVSFSASVEGGFRGYLVGEMLGSGGTGRHVADSGIAG